MRNIDLKVLRTKAKEKKAKEKIGIGYREVLPSEILLPTDECFFLGPEEWFLTCFEGDQANQHPRDFYRRKIDSKYLAKKEMSAGYREILPSETLLPTDEYFSFGEWVPTAFAGEKAGNLATEFYRRKIYCTSDWENFPDNDAKKLNPVLKCGVNESVWSDNSKPKPPLGLKPKYISEAERDCEVVAAIKRYLDANLAVPADWLKEYFESPARQQCLCKNQKVSCE